MRLLAARFACSVTIDDPALRKIVRRDLKIDAIARQQFDVVTTQTARDVAQDGPAVFQFHREGCARKDLLDGAKELERRLFDRHERRRAGGGFLF